MAAQSPVALPEPLDDSIVGTPPRRPGSARRTSTIDMVWPGGFGTPLNLVGRARDLLTPLVGEPVVIGEAEMLVAIGAERTIEAIETVPTRPGVEALVGTRGGSYLRGAIEKALPGEREAATPLHLLLDDVAGTSLIAGFAWSRWQPEIRSNMRRLPPEFGMRKGRIICSGLRPGGWAQTARERAEDQAHATRFAGDISSPGDPLAWHELPERPEVCMRRHRRVDVRQEGDSLFVDAFFRDSCWEPDGTEMALHEYTVEAEVDADLADVDRRECPTARVAVPRVPVGRAARRPARRHARRRLSHQRAGDTGRAAMLHAPQRHAALSGGGSVARRRTRESAEIMSQALDGLRVVDLSNTLSGTQTSQLFADFGAEVVHVEPPGGSPLRAQPAYPFWARGKKSIELDLHDPSDRDVAYSLSSDADVLIETFRPGVADRLGLGYEALSHDNPGLVYGSITAFGRNNALSHLKGYEGVVMAKLGGYNALSNLAGRARTGVRHGGVLLGERGAHARAGHPRRAVRAREQLARAVGGDHAGAGSCRPRHVELDRPSASRAATPTRSPRCHASTRRATCPTARSRTASWSVCRRTGVGCSSRRPRNGCGSRSCASLGLEWMLTDPKWKDAPTSDDIDLRQEFWETMITAVRAKTVAEWNQAFDDDPDVFAEIFRHGTELLHHPQTIHNHQVDHDRGRRRSAPSRNRARRCAWTRRPPSIERSAPALDEHGRGAAHPSPPRHDRHTRWPAPGRSAAGRCDDRRARNVLRRSVRHHDPHRLRRTCDQDRAARRRPDALDHAVPRSGRHQGAAGQGERRRRPGQRRRARDRRTSSCAAPTPCCSRSVPAWWIASATTTRRSSR